MKRLHCAGRVRGRFPCEEFTGFGGVCQTGGYVFKPQRPRRGAKGLAMLCAVFFGTGQVMYNLGEVIGIHGIMCCFGQQFKP